jgi:peptidyl-Asp metalloendopeptidase
MVAPSGQSIRGPGSHRVLLGVAALVATTTLFGQAQGQAVPSLLGPAPAGARVPAALAQRTDTLQARAVSVNAAALAADVFDLELAPGRVVRAALDRRENHRNGVQTWAGRLIDEPLSAITLAWSDGVIQGSVQTLDGVYSLEPSGAAGVHVLRLVDTAATGVELEPLVPELPLVPAPGDEAPIAGDDGSTFDVIAFYTPAAATAASGAGTAVQTRIALGVSETNTAFANAGAIPRFRLVGTVQTNYTEAGDLSTDLSRFRTPGDGYMDEVHAARDAAGADFVVLIVGSVAGGACGVGYVMTSLSSGFASYAFSVTAYSCISPGLTLAHELGHNMGSAHAPEDGAGQASLYPYSYGYKHPANLFRTVMAYNCPGGCPRIVHFSNPNVSYGGAPTGTVAQHNNALTINNGRTTIANWRQSVGGGGTNTPPSVTRSPASASILVNTAAQTTVTVTDADTPGSSLGLTASSSNSMLLPNARIGVGVSSTSSTARTFTVTMTPNAGQVGSAVVTLVGSDGVASASTTFSLSVSSSSSTPGAPSNLNASFTGRTVQISWTAPAGNPVTGYALEVGSAPGLTDLAAFPLGTATSFSAGGVPDGVFWVRVRPSNSAGAGPATADLGLVMRPSGGCVGLPQAPVFLAPMVSGNNVGLSWSAPGGPGPSIAGYVVAAGSAPGLSNIVVFDTGSAATSLTAAAPSGTYFVRAAARNACGIGAVSNEVIVAVP